MEKINLEKIKADYSKKKKVVKKRIILCAGTGCIANGAMEIHKEFLRILKEKKINAVVELKKEQGDIHISGSGCQGFCQMGPLVNVLPHGVFYVKVKKEDVLEIVEKSIEKDEIVERLLCETPSGDKKTGKDDLPFYAKQHRFALKLCGNIDASCIEEYIYNDGYKAAMDVYNNYSDKEVCDTITESGLRGRGGGGFPTGRKWEFARIEKSDKKYVICNGDEGDPGAFMDRSVMEGNPHAVIEGMLICAKGIGANEGYVYVRTEYPLAVSRMKKAVEDAEELGVLGDNILNTDKSFKLHVMEGAGAFVCGEETALMASIEGKRGMPKPKPPFPAQKGLWNQPTVINNVETLATVGLIINMGVNKFKSIGTDNSSGTKTFALTGHVANTGLIEVPFGTTLREIVFDIGGGVTNAKGEIDNDAFKAVQIGGPSGGCLTAEHLDMPMDFDSLTSIGAMVGSGGLVVMNNDTCIIQIAKFFMQFTQNESCGKCVPCREGTKQMLSMLDDIIDGNADETTLTNLRELGLAVKKASLCGLGKTAPSPVLSTMDQFYDEYIAHIEQKRCPAKKCKALLSPEIDPEKCKGCTLCARKCPVGAIKGKVKEAHIIDDTICIKCGVCAEVCKFNAVQGV